MLAVIALLASWPVWTPGPSRAVIAQPSAQSRALAAGLWGGDHIRMVVDGSGAQVEYDCGSGTIDQPIALDANGRFSAKGLYKPQHGGPRREGETSGERAQYVGRVNGDTMTLTVTLENGGERIGRFSLARGVDPLLTKCR